MRIGVLGGTFDPPHLGHIALAEAATATNEFDLLLWVVTAGAWQKEQVTAADVRLHMCQLAIDSHPGWSVCAVDLDRGGETYSLDTQHDLQTLYPNAEIIWIIGSDTAAGLPTWHEADAVAQELKFKAYARTGHTVELPPEFSIDWVQVELPQISSTEVRRLYAAGESERARELVPTPVADYIEQIGLYQP